MRVALLSDHEREMLRVYLKEGIKREGFRTLLFRIRHNHEGIKEDLALIERVLEASKTEKRRRKR